jgi:nicotinamidase-related amidase
MKRVQAITTRALMSAALAATAIVVAMPCVQAQTIIEEWDSVKVPPPPALKAVKVDPKTTALIILDLVRPGCNAERRPRCLASLPKIAKLAADARSHNVTVMHTTYTKPEDIWPEMAPKAGEPVVVALNDKFINTDLEKTLKDKGLTTVILVGTAAHGAVLSTGGSAALRGFQVIVPVDGASAESTFAELSAVWMLANAPTISSKVTVTKMDMISY